MSLLSRLRHPRSGVSPDTTPDDPATDLPVAPDVEEPPAPEPVAAPVPAAPAGIPCPSCARIVDPPPARARKCPHCRHLIVVRRTDGRTVYLTEAAVEVFEAERQREADMAMWTAQRAEWLRLAHGVGAAEERARRIAARPVSAEAVAEARELYVAGSARAIKAADKARSWDIAARYGREQALALYRDAGSPVPPPDEIRAIHATAMAALLRGLEGTGTHAEIVGGTCCAACRRDDGRAFVIKAELKADRLPHADCPHGLCACEWWIGGTPFKRKRRRRAPTQV